MDRENALQFAALDVTLIYHNDKFKKKRQQAAAEKWAELHATVIFSAAHLHTEAI